jgi:Ca-activated chloride channel family protein
VIVRLWFLSVLALPGVSLMPGQVHTFKSSVEAVRVDVLVTRGGRPVEGLTAGDFDVLDNGVLQQIDRAAFEEIPLNVVFALDTSSSVEGERAQHLRAASRGVLDRLKSEDHAALVTFGETVVVRSGLTRDMSAIRLALDQTQPLGETSLVDASYTGLLLGESQPGRALVIVFSDGVEVSSYLDPEAVVEAGKRSDSVVYGVALKSLVKAPFLRRLADASGGDFFEIESIRDIDAAFVKVLDQFRRRYLLSYTPRGVERGGWHRLEVRVKQRGVAVKARPGYLRG